MRRHSILLCCFAFAVAACNKTKPVHSPVASDKAEAASPAQSPPPIGTPAVPESTAGLLDACSLLTSEQIQSVLGEPVTETKPTVKAERGIGLSQCYFVLPTASNSMVLTVFQKGSSANARDPSGLWKETFHHEPGEEKKGEEKEEKAKPQKIDGLGDEAFWTGNAIGGALYVLKANTYLRISVGGRGDQAEKTQKCRALAEIVLQRL
jgi:hypothetical protein